MIKRFGNTINLSPFANFIFTTPSATKEIINKAIPLAIMSDIDDFRKPYTVHNISATTIKDNVAKDTPSFFLLTHIVDFYH